MRTRTAPCPAVHLPRRANHYVNDLRHYLLADLQPRVVSLREAYGRPMFTILIVHLCHVPACTHKRADPFDAATSATTVTLVNPRWWR